MKALARLIFQNIKKSSLSKSWEITAHMYSFTQFNQVGHVQTCPKPHWKHEETIHDLGLLPLNSQPFSLINESLKTSVITTVLITHFLTHFYNTET